MAHPAQPSGLCLCAEVESTSFSFESSYGAAVGQTSLANLGLETAEIAAVCTRLCEFRSEFLNPRNCCGDNHRCAESVFANLRWRTHAARVCAGRTAVRILRFDAAVASASATYCSWCSFCRVNSLGAVRCSLLPIRRGGGGISARKQHRSRC
jgi:hypothetical protein